MRCSYFLTISLVLAVHCAMISMIYLSILPPIYSEYGRRYSAFLKPMRPTLSLMPNLVTMLCAIWQAFWRSSAAPLVEVPQKYSYAHLPPRMKHIWSMSWLRVFSLFSLLKYCAKPSDPLERGMMVSLRRGSAPSRNQDTTACPDSCTETIFFSNELTMPLFSMPPISLSVAIQKSCASTADLLFLAAKSAAQLQRLAMSAPENPGVREASLLAQSFMPFPYQSIILARCTLKICLLPQRSGRLTSTMRSNRPGLMRAGSSRFCLLVAAITITFESVPKPSISTNIWLSVLSRSSWEPWLPLLLRPTASISSIKIIAGDFWRADANRSRTREAPTPTKIQTKSDPEVGMKGTPASPAQALASMVFPVPGGPERSTPLGILAPNFLYFCGFLRKSTNSITSTLLSSSPATSANLTLLLVITQNPFFLPRSCSYTLEPPFTPPVIEDDLEKKAAMKMAESRFATSVGSASLISQFDRYSQVTLDSLCLRASACFSLWQLELKLTKQRLLSFSKKTWQLGLPWEIKIRTCSSLNALEFWASYYSKQLMAYYSASLYLSTAQRRGTDSSSPQFHHGHFFIWLNSDYDLLVTLCHMSAMLTSCFPPCLPFPSSFSAEKGKDVPLVIRVVRGRHPCASNFDNFTIIYKFYDVQSPLSSPNVSDGLPRI